MGRRVQTALRLMAALGAIAAPALFAQVALTQTAQAQSYQAQAPAYQALPAPPYAATVAAGARYSGSPTYDRYGGGAAHANPMAADAAPTAYAGPRLAWAGKVETAQAQQPTVANGPAPRAPWAVRYAQPRQAVAPQYNASSQPAVSAPPPAPAGWTYVPPIGPPAPTNAPAAALPTSIYDPAPPAPQTAPAVVQGYAPQGAAAPVAASATPAAGPHIYSLHRDYGMAPDPIPLPPQFFGATADLTQPETPEPARRTVGADGKARNAAQPTEGQ